MINKQKKSKEKLGCHYTLMQDLEIEIWLYLKID